MTIETTKTPENAREALRPIGEIIDREKCSRTALFKRLGITGYASVDLANGSGCTPAMLERVRTEHTRVYGAKAAPGVKAAAKAGIVVRPRDEEPEAEEEEEHEEEELEEEDDAEEDDGEEELEETDDGDPAETDDEEPVRFGPTVPGKGAPMVSAFVEAPAGMGKTAAVRATSTLDASITAAQLPGILNELVRSVAVIELLGGIERAERIAAAIGGAL